MIRIGIASAALVVIACMGEFARAIPVRPMSKVNEVECPAWHTTRICFEVRRKQWSDVMEWFADQTKAPIHGLQALPEDAFTFINPRDADGELRRYTLCDVFDILNESLQARYKFTLVRNNSGLYLLPADEPVPGQLVPRVTLSELPDRGRTEIVEVLITPLVNLQVDELAPEGRPMRPMPADFGHAIRIPGNQMILRGDVATLLRWVNEGRIR